MATCSANPKWVMAALADWTFLLADPSASRDANWERALRQRFSSRTPQLAMSILSFPRKLAHRPRAETEVPTCRRQVESAGPAVGGCRSASRRFAIRVSAGGPFAFKFSTAREESSWDMCVRWGKIIKRTGSSKHPLRRGNRFRPLTRASSINLPCKDSSGEVRTMPSRADSRHDGRARSIEWGFGPREPGTPGRDRLPGPRRISANA